MLIHIVIAFGYIGIFIAVFAESGFLLGFFLPGDSLLFTVGLLAAGGYFSIIALIVLAAVAAIVGDSFGYATGRIFGPKIFKRPDSLFFSTAYVERTEKFFKKYGRKTIIMARFVPIVRTFAPVMAGVAKMKYRTFVSFNIIGGVAWTAGFLCLSYWLGGRFPFLSNYLSYIIIVIVILSIVPIAVDYARTRSVPKKV